jgi:acyl-CoA hydrolase
VQVDTTAPQLTVSHSGATASVLARDGGSGLAAVPVCSDSLGLVPPLLVPDVAVAGKWSFLVTGDGRHAIACDVSDLAGNAAVTATDTVEIDTTPPSVTCDSADAAWHKDNVAIACRASETGSGLAHAEEGDFSLSTVVADGSADGNASTSAHPAICDRAGNCSPTPTIRGIKVDRAAPTVTLSGCPAKPLASTDTAPSLSVSARDADSGLATDPSGAATLPLSPGRQRARFTATDVAGNSASGYCNYIVVRAPMTPWVSGLASAPGLLAYWRLGEAGGTLAHDGLGGLDGTFDGARLGATGALSGDPDTAAQFDGTGARVSLPALPDSVDFAVEGWQKISTSGVTPSNGNNTLFGGGGLRLMPRPAGYYAGVTLGGSEYRLEGGTASNAAVWVHWALTRSGPDLALYRNGVQVAARHDLPATTPAHVTGAAIGRQGNANAANAATDDVALYDKALTASQVAAQLAAAGPPAPVFTTPYPSAVAAAPGLLAFWRLGDASATTARDALGLSDGTYSASGVSVGVVGAMAADPDPAARFDGTGGQIAVPAPPDSLDFTVEGWQRISTSGATPTNGNNTLFGGAGLRLMPRPAGYYAGVTLGGSEYRLEGASASNVGVWAHWALTRTGADLALYRNGVQVAARHDLPATTPTHITGAAIGRQSNSNSANATIDDVALYGKALTAAQVAAQLAAAGPVSPTFTTPYPSAVAATPGLLGYWRLGDASATTARDALGLADGAYSASGVSVGTGGALAADSDAAARFDGSGGQVTVPAPPDSTDLTVEGWEKVSTVGLTPSNGNNTLFGGGGLRLLVRPAGFYAGVTLGGSEYRLEGASASNVGVWAHWALTRTGPDLALYRNGVQVAARHDLPAGTPTHVTGAAIGRQSNSNSANASIDEVAVYSKALTSTQIAAHNAAGR